MKKQANCQDDLRYQILAVCHPPEYAGGEVLIRPEEGQPLDSQLNIACSWALRKCLVAGCRLRLWVKHVCPKRGKAYLYSHPSWSCEILQDSRLNEAVPCSGAEDESKKDSPKAKTRRLATWC